MTKLKLDAFADDRLVKVRANSQQRCIATSSYTVSYYAKHRSGVGSSGKADSRHPSQDGFRLKIGLEPENTVFAANTRLLESTKGDRAVVGGSVYDHTTHFKLACHGSRALGARGEHICLQSI